MSGLGGTHKVTGLIDLSDHDSEAVLDTGIKVKDVVVEASKWWDTVGADLMRGYRFSEQMGGKGISADPHDLNYIPSGITRGLSWDDLDKYEKMSIVKNYHHQKYRKPMREAEANARLLG